MSNQTTDKAKIREIDDQLTELSIYLDWAKCVMEDISQGYFNHTDAVKQENAWQLVHDYDRNSQRSNMVIEFLYRAQKQLEAIQGDQTS